MLGAGGAPMCYTVRSKGIKSIPRVIENSSVGYTTPTAREFIMRLRAPELQRALAAVRSTRASGRTSVPVWAKFENRKWPERADGPEDIAIAKLRRPYALSCVNSNP